MIFPPADSSSESWAVKPISAAQGARWTRPGQGSGRLPPQGQSHPHTHSDWDGAGSPGTSLLIPTPGRKPECQSKPTEMWGGGANSTRTVALAPKFFSPLQHYNEMTLSETALFRGLMQL